MKDCFSLIKTNCKLSANIVEELKANGFIIIPNLVKTDDLPRLTAAYDSAVASASPDDIKIGRTNTRVNDFVNRGAEFDALYIYQPLLEASCQLIGQPFKLSTMHARTLHPNARAQSLHIDFKLDEEKFPLVGFIFMVDDFRSDNGATRFMLGSHKWSENPNKLTNDHLTQYENQTVTACGQSGSLIIFNGSVWHGYSANMTDKPRRSIQGAFIPRDKKSGTEFSSRMSFETLDRISPLAKYLLAI